MYDYGYNYGYDSYDYSAAASAVGIFAGVGIFMWIIGMAVAIFSIISMWKLFAKAGKKGWAAIVPIYNTIVMIEIAELPIWYIALFFVPFANIYAIFKIYIEIAHKFGKSTGFGVGMVFLNIIFIPMLSFGKAEYKGGVSASVNSNVNEVFNMQNNNMQVNQSVVNNNVPYINSQPDIMNVNSNIGNTSMMDVNASSNGSPFQPIGNVNNNVNTAPVMAIPEVAPSAMEINVASSNVVEPMNSEIVNPLNVNETPVMAIPEVAPSAMEINVASSNVVEPATINSTMNDVKKTCPNCGNQVDFSAMFCTNCGYNL